jgi:hypothetical protein
MHAATTADGRLVIAFALPQETSAESSSFFWLTHKSEDARQW